MGFNIVFTCSYTLDIDCINDMLSSKTFAECYIDEDIITSDLVDSITMSKKASKYIMEQIDFDNIELSSDETPHDTFCSIIKEIIVDNNNIIKDILNESESDQEDNSE